MGWNEIDGRIVTLPELKGIIAPMPKPLWFSGGVLHNTAIPNLKRIQQFSIEHWRDMWRDFFRSKGWSGGPHFFVFPDRRILLFTKLTNTGVHSPSWNGSKFGLEMCADFAIDDDDAGLGLAIKETAAAVFGEIYKHFGLDPEGIKMHYEDKKTDHACPGRDIEKDQFIDMVQEYMGEAGEHPGTVIPPPPAKVRTGTVISSDNLNLRSRSSMGGDIVGSIPPRIVIEVLGEANNSGTKWLHVKTPAGHSGWVAGRFVKIR